MTLPASAGAASAEARYVPDGDPCPVHSTATNPIPTRLMQMPGLGLYSQGPCCREAFLAWFADHLRTTPAVQALGDTRLHPKGEQVNSRPQLELGTL